MKIGWLDYSKEEKRKAMELLKSIYEAGTLDELGIAPIRDGFANLFFPGITTIQTRAKYFLIVPYALIDIMNKEKIDDPFIDFYKIENRCCNVLLKNCPNEYGIIGGDNSGRTDDYNWVKRKPSEIYWTGLERFTIINEYMPLNNFLKNEFKKKTELNETLFLGKKYNDKNEANRNYEDNSSDDTNPLLLDSNAIIDSELVTNLYKKDWINNDLKISLTKEEAEYLRKKIISSLKIKRLNKNGKIEPDCILTTLIEKGEKMPEKFEEIERLLDKSQLNNFYLACKFNEFQSIIHLIYYSIVYQFDAVKELKSQKINLNCIDKEELDEIYQLLGINAQNNINYYKNRELIKFLNKSLELLERLDIEGSNATKIIDELKEIIKKRAYKLKGSRAKTNNPVKKENLVSKDYEHNLDYRYSNARWIINDIIEGVGKNA